jgi:DNA-binding transcriptional regulator YiaG
MNEEKRELWKQRIEDFRGSKLSQREFAKRNGIAVNTLQNWLKKIQPEPEALPETQWLEVKAAEPAKKASAMILEIGGVRIAVPEDFNPEFLKSVVRTLKQP